MSSHIKNIKRQLATESIVALVRLRQTGQPPTHEDSPLLMDIWKRMLNRILADGPANKYGIRGCGKALRFRVTVLWDDKNRLSKFLLYDVITGSLLLAGDMNGPVFSGHKPSTFHAAIENQTPTKAKAIS